MANIQAIEPLDILLEWPEGLSQASLFSLKLQPSSEHWGVGIDPGLSKFAVAVIMGDPSGETWVGEFRTMTKAPTTLRLNAIHNTIRLFVRVATEYGGGEMALIRGAIEGAAFNKAYGQAHLGEARGVSLAALFHLWSDVAIIPPRKARAIVLGNGGFDPKALWPSLNLSDGLDALALAAFAANLRLNP